MNLHLRVSPKLYEELFQEAKNVFCEGDTAEFFTVSGKFFVSRKGRHENEVVGYLYAGKHSNTKALRARLTGEESGD